VKGDTVLYLFLGEDTTVRAAMQNDRNSVGYEIDATLLLLIKRKQPHSHRHANWRSQDTRLSPN
jgi:DNA modification methylase